MPSWKKFRFEITGERDEEKLTRLTIPMARLADYIRDLAEVLGNKEYVHLMGIEEGSAVPLIWMTEPAYNPAMAQLRSAQMGIATRDANEAYRRIDDRLREDKGSADFVDEDTKAKVFEFLGHKSVPTPEIRGIREQASITGELRRVGGLDKTIHLQVRRADGEVFYIESDENFAKQLEGRLFTLIRVNGIATWSRNASGKWILERFRAQSFDPEPLIDEPFGTTLDRLKSLPGNKWAESKDPFEELRKLRHGDEEPTQ